MTVEEFARTARALAHATRSLGLVVPAFRSPPRVAGAARTLRRYPEGVVISVRLDRPADTVAADLIDGVIAANGITDPDQVAAVRDQLHAAA